MLRSSLILLSWGFDSSVARLTPPINSPGISGKVVEKENAGAYTSHPSGVTRALFCTEASEGKDVISLRLPAL